MKVERKESKFEPVVITLESQLEVDVLHELCASVEPTGLSEVSDLIEILFDKLSGYTNQDILEDHYFTGIIEVNEGSDE